MHAYQSVNLIILENNILKIMEEDKKEQVQARVRDLLPGLELERSTLKSIQVCTQYALHLFIPLHGILL